MSFKSIFIKTDESSENKPVEKSVKENTIKFPTSETSKPLNVEKPKKTNTFDFGFDTSSKPAPTVFVPSTNISVTEEQIEKAYTIYQNGFDSLNQPGYDFYEYYKMVLAGGIENAPIYAMAFAMGKSTDATITKESLISKADFYLDEINKVYNNFASQGNNKKQEIIGQKTQENQLLLSEVESIKEQIESLKIQLSDREHKLSVIDTKYSTAINDVDTKLMANSIAKDKIVGNIETVKNGIINNVN